MHLGQEEPCQQDSVADEPSCPRDQTGHKIATTVVTAAWGATANSFKTGAGSKGLSPQFP